MSRSVARRVASLGVVALGCALLWGGSPASADTFLPVKAKVRASTHIERMDRDIKGLKGRFKGKINLDNGRLGGRLRLPPATVAFPSHELGIAEAEFSIPLTRVKGRVNLETLRVRTKSVFDIHVTSVTALGLPANAAGDNCKTSEPITVRMKGKFNPTEPATFSGVYTIPPFEDCQLVTPVFNLLVPGPNNTFTARFRPIP